MTAVHLTSVPAETSSSDNASAHHGAGGHGQDPAAAHGARDLALWVENVTVSFDGFKALNDITLLLDRGELRCIIGPTAPARPRSWT